MGFIRVGNGRVDENARIAQEVAGLEGAWNHDQHQMTTDDMSLDRTDPRGAIAADSSYQDEAKAFDELASLCSEQRCRCLKVGPLEHSLLQVEGGTHKKKPIPSRSHPWPKTHMWTHNPH